MTTPVYETDALIADDIDAYLDQHQNKSLLRFITCGSVDDGKSTLIGRLLYDSKMIFEDQLAALESDSKKVGTQGQEIDFALLVDGLAAEREQGITIDVAYRFFATEKRKFIVADTPGHEQYTRNMVTGASTADCAVILVDARKGMLVQTRRHSYLAHLLGIKHLVLAVNKMDLVGYDQATFDQIVADYSAFAKEIGIESFTAIPISGFKGDNITAAPSDNTSWYDGPSLISHLENIEIANVAAQEKSFRMPVQWVNRPNLDFRGFSGLIGSGSIKPGDTVRVVPSGTTSTVKSIVTFDGELDEAVAGQSVTITLADEVDCSRGDVIAAADNPPEASDQFEATLVWMDEEALKPGRGYWLKLASQLVTATIQEPKYEINVNNVGGSGEKLATKTLELNSIGVAEVHTERPITFEPYDNNRALGGFILVDKITNATVGAGMLHFSLRRASNVHWQATTITRDHHADLKNQKPRVLWFTGLSGSGKSTIANAVEQRLNVMNRHTFLLDGDNVRHGLNKDLGFTEADRIENIRRVGEVAKLMTDAGLIVLTAFISPFRAERDLVRGMMEECEFIEIFVDTPLDVAEQRDVKGLYKKARSGELKNFTGIDSPYEAPDEPEIRVNTVEMTVEEAADHIISQIMPLK
ncbi:sulfate adenylyltransferase subunit CysN [Pontixanthobacter aestiaquae]|uniref:Multifunctional fusion protein n=1 Tax=Pontixanthobacter aestiaquae TaxID=1509367 RepID=A0A844Z2S9_9SPHN|nr:sulfate adenylyltransferase subunit CysN [Pontixanthobacter aestiaquae]MDN3647024.1 sulfate adenylyltransferase subunit CysN [Pontixanthobacter aestiaquae]MXO81998.1 sulfate adenylyltransferase subunit CysN [Pontixanthobacter aestiaquae]